MSLASSPKQLFGPEGKAMSVLFSSGEESSSFEESFNEEMYRLNHDEDDGQDQFGSFEDIFRDYDGTRAHHRLPELEVPAKYGLSQPDPWKKGVWALKQMQPPKLTIQKVRKTEPQRPPARTIEQHNFDYPRLTMGTSYINQAKRFATSPNIGPASAKPMLRPPCSSKEPTLSPSPMYAQLSSSKGYGHEELNDWQQEFQDFHLQTQYEQLALPPHASRGRCQHSSAVQAMNAATTARNHGLAISNYSNGGQFESIVDPRLLGGPETVFTEHSDDPSHGLMVPHHIPQFTGEHSNDLSPFGDSLPSSSSSSHSRRTQTDASNTTDSVQSQTVMSPVEPGAHPPLPTLAPEDLYPVLAAPTPQRAPHQLLQRLQQQQQQQQQQRPGEQNSLMGLGIQYPELEQMSEAVLLKPQSFARVVQVPAGNVMPNLSDISGYRDAYTPLPTPPEHVFSEISPFSASRKPRRERSRTPSPSPSVSPTHVGTRRQGQRSPTRPELSHHHRRKSIHKAGPIKDGSANEPLPSAPRARARSQSRPPRTPKTPKTPAGTVGFVNFTPKDAAKLLNDVAPSGSSKTRARREQEAREKRKRLSEAALKAVQVAGGDVSMFEKAIFA